VKGYILSKVAYLFKGNRNTFISGIIIKLKKLKPFKRIKGVLPFNPLRILYSLFYNKRYLFPIV
jgi:hypothetical protein